MQVHIVVVKKLNIKCDQQTHSSQKLIVTWIPDNISAIPDLFIKNIIKGYQTSCSHATSRQSRDFPENMTQREFYNVVKHPIQATLCVKTNKTFYEGNLESLKQRV